MRIRLSIISVILFLLASCGEYEQLLKSSDYELKKAKAIEYFQTKEYSRAAELLSQVIPRFRASSEAEELNWLYAQSFYGMRQFDLSSTYFKSLVEQYPFGTYAEEASFLGALSDYYLSPRAELDQTSTRNAIEGFNVFINRYPLSQRIEEAKKYITELQDKLVEKSYMNARLYYNMKEYKAAITALTNSLKEFSESKYREEMMFLKLNSLFLYAENSYAVLQKERYQATLDEYFSFMEEFPESTYSREVSKIYEETARNLNIDGSENLVNLQ